jgi:hypothetical protein
VKAGWIVASAIANLKSEGAFARMLYWLSLLAECARPEAVIGLGGWWSSTTRPGTTRWLVILVAA